MPLPVFPSMLSAKHDMGARKWIAIAGQARDGMREVSRVGRIVGNEMTYLLREDAMRSTFVEGLEGRWRMKASRNARGSESRRTDVPEVLEDQGEEQRGAWLDIAVGRARLRQGGNEGQTFVAVGRDQPCRERADAEQARKAARRVC